MVCYATRPLPKWEFKDFLGWMEQGDGKLAYGIYVQNGRLKGDLKKALRMVIERYELPVRLTANQNLILCDIEEDWKADIISTLSGAGIKYVSLMQPVPCAASAASAIASMLLSKLRRAAHCLQSAYWHGCVCTYML